MLQDCQIEGAKNQFSLCCLAHTARNTFRRALQGAMCTTVLHYSSQNHSCIFRINPDRLDLRTRGPWTCEKDCHIYFIFRHCNEVISYLVEVTK